MSSDRRDLGGRLYFLAAGAGSSVAVSYFDVGGVPAVVAPLATLVVAGEVYLCLAGDRSGAAEAGT